MAVDPVGLESLPGGVPTPDQTKSNGAGGEDGHVQPGTGKLARGIVELDTIEIIDSSEYRASRGGRVAKDEITTQGAT